MTNQLIDASTLPPPVRHPRIFEAFDALAVGESFVLANDHYPLPLLYQFQAERPNQFDWSVLEAGARFRVEIRRRDANEPRGVSEYLAWDHDRLDRLFADTIDAFEQSSIGAARERFGEFACGLERHIRIEEDILFPLFEMRVPSAGPTEVMRLEHVEIRRALEDISSALACEDGQAFDAGVEALVGVLEEHNMKEERVLYPLLDRWSSAADRAELVRKMQTAPV